MGRDQMRRLSGCLAGLGLVILLAACGAEAAPSISSVASVEINPPPSPIASATPAPPTATQFIQPTITLAPTHTRPPVTVDAANPLQPTFTNAPSTQTATFRAPLAPLSIDYFITNNTFTNSESVTLFWRVVGAERVRIYRVTGVDQASEVWDVGAEGRLTVSLNSRNAPAEANPRFLLRAEARENVQEQTLTLDTTCNLEWFFLPAPQGCPAALPTFTQQVEQRFEGGLMLWLGNSQEIYVLFTDGARPTWSVYPDRFTDGLPERDDSLSPPQDRYQPVRGFGLVWRDTAGVRARLGWALAPEVGYDGSIQLSSDVPSRVYMRERQGGIFALASGGASWEILPFTDVTPNAPLGLPSDGTPSDDAELEDPEASE